MVNHTGIQTDRLMLKVLDDSFAPRVLDFFIRNKEFFRQWESAREDIFYSLDFQKEQLTNELKKIDEGSLFKVWIFEKADQDFKTVIGSVSLSEIIRGCFQSCFLGYRMDEQKNNRGYTTEAVKAIIHYAFNTLKLHRIEANIMPENTASIKVVEKLGFINEGLAAKYLNINGRWEDHIHMVILNGSIE
ncbi:GNAT family N-acetyltransferase [Geosporobacter ferrireducens]|uniref:Alanine acetyltransferase n=1 Tax=Geosporobacter ferrireducens TaxID=1424294 RepID=A0A1D8GKP6_9FIRM|nr:GNAT family N-acetyltransferase [Geosporobacter ferrireducens]AOT71495.1 alanine acetyltransferase [Geosporobacter ferrireducens]MTI57805.1 GNAT family N-acetyltransferase [Geosporobacter ferrireducens]